MVFYTHKFCSIFLQFIFCEPYYMCKFRCGLTTEIWYRILKTHNKHMPWDVLTKKNKPESDVEDPKHVPEENGLAQNEQIPDPSSEMDCEVDGVELSDRHGPIVEPESDVEDLSERDQHKMNRFQIISMKHVQDMNEKDFEGDSRIQWLTWSYLWWIRVWWWWSRRRLRKGLAQNRHVPNPSNWTSSRYKWKDCKVESRVQGQTWSCLWVMNLSLMLKTCKTSQKETKHKMNWFQILPNFQLNKFTSLI